MLKKLYSRNVVFSPTINAFQERAPSHVEVLETASRFPNPSPHRGTGELHNARSFDQGGFLPGKAMYIILPMIYIEFQMYEANIKKNIVL